MFWRSGPPPAEGEQRPGAGSRAPAGLGAPCRWPEPAPARQYGGWAGGGFCLPVLYTLFSRWGGGKGAEKVFEFQSGLALKAFGFCCGGEEGRFTFQLSLVDGRWGGEGAGGGGVCVQSL